VLQDRRENCISGVIHNSFIMITRSKLVEQLRDSQIRSQHKWSLLVIFSPKPNISNWYTFCFSL
ncbi:hypothetical protein R6Q57_014224, partial [Mikania cordata]